MRILFFIFILLFSNTAFAQAPKLSRAQVAQLYNIAGFNFASNGIILKNKCNQIATPKLSFIDISQDGRKEALIIDQGPCYGTDGKYYALAALQNNGIWKILLKGEGTIATTGTSFNNWFVFTTISKGITKRYRYNGSDYAEVLAPNSLTPKNPVLLTGTPLSKDYLAIDEVKAKANLAALTQAERLKIYQAAGLKKQKNGKWTACIDDDSGFSEASLTMIYDINNDGKPEAIIEDSGTFCNGNAGIHTYIINKPNGQNWKIFYDSQGSFNFLKSFGANNYPDIQLGLPGLCIPYLRYDGKEYKLFEKRDMNFRVCVR